MEAKENPTDSEVSHVTKSQEFHGVNVITDAVENMEDSVWGAWVKSDSEESEDEIVLVDISTPMDSNCQISSIFSKLAALLGLGPKYLQAGKKYFTQTGQRLEEAFGQVALLELFKITDVKAFQYASHKFKEGLEQRRSPTELLDMVVHAKKVRG